MVRAELAGHRANSANADLSLTPLDLKALPIQVQSPRAEVTRATDRRRVREIAIKTTTLDAHSTIAVIADIEVEVVAAILDTGLASYRIDFVAPIGRGRADPRRLGAGPDQIVSRRDQGRNGPHERCSRRHEIDADRPRIRGVRRRRRFDLERSRCRLLCPGFDAQWSRFGMCHGQSDPRLCPLEPRFASR